MKINVTTEEFRNLILLVLFADILEVDELKDSNYKTIVEKLIKNGFKSRLLDFFMNTSSNERIAVKWLIKSFEKKSNIINNINIFPDPTINESSNDEFNDYLNAIIEETIKVVVGKENPNPRKMAEVKEVIFNRLEEKYGVFYE